MARVGRILHIISLGKSFHVKDFSNEQRKYCGLTAMVVSNNLDGTFKIDIDDKDNDWHDDDFVENTV